MIIAGCLQLLLSALNLYNVPLNAALCFRNEYKWLTAMSLNKKQINPKG